MLMESKRLTSADRLIWIENEIADRIVGKRLDAKIAKSKDAICRFLDAGPAYCGVSWGKDSVVVAHLCHSFGVPLSNLRCSNRNPDCDVVRDVFLASNQSEYHEVEIDYSAVDRRQSDESIDRETDRLWHAGIHRGCDQVGTKRHILGLRGNESVGRYMRMKRWTENSPNGCAPLAWWTAVDVFGYLARFDLPVHPAYAMTGGGRWPREHLRVAEIGDTHGRRMGRSEWEREYYPDELNRMGIK